MNVELLRKIAAVIQERPAEFAMPAFHDRGECGTTRCIGGWTDELGGSDRRNREVVLGINARQASRLFYATDWPEQFQGKEPFPEGSRWYDDGAGTLPACWNPTIEQTVARIELFIETEGRE
jgi:hypothetical protein